MTVTKNDDGTFSVTFTNARQLELVIARLGLVSNDGPTYNEEFALFEQFHDAVSAVGVNTSPLKAGLVRFEDLSDGEKLIAILAGEGPTTFGGTTGIGTDLSVEQTARIN